MASPSIIATTISPEWASSWRRTTTTSPSQIAASTIDSPRTRSPNTVPEPTSSDLVGVDAFELFGECGFGFGGNVGGLRGFGDGCLAMGGKTEIDGD